MRTLTLLALLAFPVLSAAHEDAVVAVPYDELWRRTNQALAIHGFTITSGDKDAGIINAEVNKGAEAEWFAGCPKGKGHLGLYGYSVTILLNVLSPESTGLRVAAVGINTWFQVDHYGLFRKRLLPNTVRCTGTSNGDAERLVLSHITGTSS
jgi:hypothetical protein